MNKKNLRQQIELLKEIKLQLETIINHPNRNILDIMMVDYVILQRDNIDSAIQQSILIERLDDKGLMEYREEENNNIIQSIYLDNIFNILDR